MLFIWLSKKQFLVRSRSSHYNFQLFLRQVIQLRSFLQRFHSTRDLVQFIKNKRQLWSWCLEQLSVDDLCSEDEANLWFYVEDISTLLHSASLLLWLKPCVISLAHRVIDQLRYKKMLAWINAQHHTDKHDRLLIVSLSSHLQDILSQSTVALHIEVHPRYLIPDTNCFVDDLISIKAIASAHPLYQLMIPITGKVIFRFKRDIICRRSGRYIVSQCIAEKKRESSTLSCPIRGLCSWLGSWPDARRIPMSTVN